MTYIPEIASISDMRVRSGEIVAAAQRGPVILIEKGSRPALVVVSPERWNALMARLELLEDAVDVYETRMNQASGKSKVVPFDLTEYVADDPTDADSESTSLSTKPSTPSSNRVEEGRLVSVGD
ncbi:MAG: type II toxin-antitoxin system prevent-host-death family antitoxin [Caldilinea sp. CFX5]|nr:type II toxin-antitoxin system prevent-host-death family antitoxin [Caldilinea sp. CFX5]